MKHFILLIMLLFSVPACAENDIFTIEGKIFLKGSEPHTYLVIEDDQSHKVYKIKNKNSFDLMHKQKQFIKFKVRLLKEAIGPGYPALVEIIDIEE
jgi:hypothetical protein